MSNSIHHQDILYSLYIISLGPVVPAKPSGQIMWTIRRSFDALIKVQNRLLSRAQQTLYHQACNALVAIGGLVDLLGWVSVK